MGGLKTEFMTHISPGTFKSEDVPGLFLPIKRCLVYHPPVPPSITASESVK